MPDVSELEVNPTLLLIGRQGQHQAAWCRRHGGMAQGTFKPRLVEALLAVRAGGEVGAWFGDDMVAWLLDNDILVERRVRPRYVAPLPVSEVNGANGDLIVDDAWELCAPPVEPVGPHLIPHPPRLRERVSWGTAREIQAPLELIAAFSKATSGEPVTADERELLRRAGVLRRPDEVTARRKALDDALARWQAAWRAASLGVVELVCADELDALRDYVRAVRRRGPCSTATSALAANNGAT
ncbi:MAG: hypothetical protein IPO67_28480 [Deltaproteobacteria bacterium]|nr:hypothetical protein [Deltaproteobacteria bacterium]